MNSRVFYSTVSAYIFSLVAPAETEGFCKIEDFEFSHSQQAAAECTTFKRFANAGGTCVSSAARICRGKNVSLKKPCHKCFLAYEGAYISRRTLLPPFSRHFGLTGCEVWSTKDVQSCVSIRLSVPAALLVGPLVGLSWMDSCTTEKVVCRHRPIHTHTHSHIYAHSHTPSAVSVTLLCDSTQER